MELASDLKPGMVLRHEGQLCLILSTELRMGGGRMGAMEQIKLRNLATGSVLERRFRPEERLEVVEVQKQKLEYLYQDGEFYVFMNPESYDQVSIHTDQLGDKVRFLKDEMMVTGLFFEERILSLQFPEFVDLRVVTSPPPTMIKKRAPPRVSPLRTGWRSWSLTLSRKEIRCASMSKQEGIWSDSSRSLASLRGVKGGRNSCKKVKRLFG